MNDSPRIPPLLVDGILAAGVLVLGLTSRVQVNEGIAATFTRSPDTLNLVLVVLMSAPLMFRRVRPVPVFAVVLLAWGVDRFFDYPDTLAPIGLAIMFHTLGTELSPRRSLRIGGTAVAALFVWTLVGVVTLESVTAPSLIFTVLATGGPLWLGREVHSRRRRMLELEERADRAEREREEETRRAVAEERARIARELHDVVAHQMTVMTLQAEGAGRIARDADPRVREALDVIRDAGRESLAEMRRMVGLLRTEADGSDTASIEPLPGLDDLDALVAQVRDAGMDVSLNREGEVRPLAEGTELSAYRIVQESLTNVARHGGPGVHAEVVVRYGDGDLTISVTDDGRGAAATQGERTGHGLVGMRERVAVLDGEFAAGPRAGGGFQVTATLPIDR